jgi:hypothetical protein
MMVPKKVVLSIISMSLDIWWKKSQHQPEVLNICSTAGGQTITGGS